MERYEKCKSIIDHLPLRKRAEQQESLIAGGLVQKHSFSTRFRSRILWTCHCSVCSFLCIRANHIHKHNPSVRTRNMTHDSLSTDPPGAVQKCHACNNMVGTLRCAQCKEMWYCTKQCQLSHWRSHHKAECKQIANEKQDASSIDLDSLQEQVKQDELSHNAQVRKEQVRDTPDDLTLSSLTISEQFPKNEFPFGELHAYRDYRRARYSSEEARERERSSEFEKQLKNAREAAEVHRQARAWLQKEISPGQQLIDLVTGMEDRVRYLIGGTFPESGVAFATGCSVNECAAHYSPNPGDFRILKKDDVIKFDLGVHKHGTIIDSAWTMCWNDKFQPLLDTVQEATEAGIRTAGVGVRLYDVAASIQEVMEAGEVELDGKTYQVQCIENLNGHNIGPYRIHHTKTVPIVKRDYKVNTRMEEMEFFAIETFGSINGEGYVDETDDNSHYMLNYQKEEHFPRNKAARRFYKQIVDNFGTLCWTFRYMHRLGLSIDEKALNYLIRDDIVTTCPPLSDIPGSYTAQFEHTLCLRPTCKEVLSRGDDY